MKNKKLFIIILSIALLAIIAVVMTFHLKLPKTISISEQYANILEDVQHVKKIEIRNGSTGESLLLDDPSKIQEIKSLIYDVKLTRDSNQSERTGWRYAIKCYKESPKEEWFELIIGGNHINDSKRGQSPYYKIENHEDLVAKLEDYFSHPKKIDVYSQLDPIRGDIVNINFFSSRTGERALITEPEDIKKIIDAMKGVQLERYDMGGETAAGSDFSVIFNSPDAEYNVVYGGDTFTWYTDLNQKKQEPVYRLVELGNSFVTLKSFLKQ